MVAPSQQAYHYPAVRAGPPELTVRISVRTLFLAKALISALSGWATAVSKSLRLLLSVSSRVRGGHRHDDREQTKND